MRADLRALNLRLFWRTGSGDGMMCDVCAKQCCQCESSDAHKQGADVYLFLRGGSGDGMQGLFERQCYECESSNAHKQGAEVHLALRGGRGDGIGDLGAERGQEAESLLAYTQGPDLCLSLKGGSGNGMGDHGAKRGFGAESSHAHTNEEDSSFSLSTHEDNPEMSYQGVPSTVAQQRQEGDPSVAVPPTAHDVPLLPDFMQDLLKGERSSELEGRESWAIDKDALAEVKRSGNGGFDFERSEDERTPVVMSLESLGEVSSFHSSDNGN